VAVPGTYGGRADSPTGGKVQGQQPNEEPYQAQQQSPRCAVQPSIARHGFRIHVQPHLTTERGRRRVLTNLAPDGRRVWTPVYGPVVSLRAPVDPSSPV